MRLWSLHPKYLDAKGLVALWRESLLARHVLQGKTKGYKNHPQLTRFKLAPAPLANIDHYLAVVFQEAERRNYTFDHTKINANCSSSVMTVTSGQMEYEKQHLLRKLKERDPRLYTIWKKNMEFEPHPLFVVVDGGVEDWEIIIS